MIIHSTFKDYKVIIEKDIEFLRNFHENKNTQYVIDEKVYHLYQAYLDWIPQERLILIEATEQNKIVDTALDICEKMTEIPAKRNVQLVSIGGGIIQDITGFVANILYRGISWIFVPTTLLASCDSCIGGKTSLNYKKYKNLLGTFYPPDEIHICSSFFNSLTERDYKSGLGEVVKFNIMAGKEGLQNIEDNINALLSHQEIVVNRFIETSLSYKKTFIEVDEFDKGERIKLNFAHTFGHAIEVITNYQIPHGTAVAIGMIMANHISVNRGLLHPQFAQAGEQVLLKVIDIDITSMNVGIEQFINAMRKDKKQTSTALTAVLMLNNSSSDTELCVVHDIEVAEVSSALKYFIQFYNAAKSTIF